MSALVVRTLIYPSVRRDGLNPLGCLYPGRAFAAPAVPSAMTTQSSDKTCPAFRALIR